MDTLQLGADQRHGMVAPPTVIPTGWADVAGVHHAGISAWRDRRTAAGGGAGATDAAAKHAALGEAYERYGAWAAPLVLRPRHDVPAAERPNFELFTRRQQRRRDFPHAALAAADAPLTDATDLVTGATVWVPAALVSLDGRFGRVATSSGLAAAPTLAGALLRALQELVERDALTTTWLHGVAARRVPSDGPAAVLDLTPQWSPHPVAAVVGSIPLHGRPRPTLGIACRASWDEAVAKARDEWAQGLVFLADRLADPATRLPASAAEVTDFDAHALYYTAHPDEWEQLPVWAGPTTAAPRRATSDLGDDLVQLRGLRDGLAAAGVRCYARRFLAPDLAALRVHAVRVLSPDLTPLHADHRWPFLGGAARHLQRRYPWTRGARWPSPHPHPLG
ncbi:MAG: YcaO-like family protein [Actinobacteria bacterium]|nr:YcaO-like family protein [Actinomycetota bacterium]